MRRKKPRSEIGRVLRYWWQIRLAMRFVRVVRRFWTAIRIAAVTAAFGGFFALVRAIRSRGSRPSPTYAPAPATPPGFGGGTRETGYEAGPGTQTERELEAEKGGDGAPAQAEEPPPVEQEPPTKT